MNHNILTLFLLHICATGALCQKIIVHPENATVKHGDNITLRCEFDKPVEECDWHNTLHGRSKARRSPNNFGYRYKYSDTIAKGRNTTNCSLLIEEVNNLFDQGYWYCYDAGDEYSQSNEAYLTVVLPGVAVSPQNATVVEGNDITLQCVFDFPINQCGWTRNGTDVNINGRYQYVDTNDNGNELYTSNCSLLIKEVDHFFDHNYWRCYHAGIYRISYWQSNDAYLTVVIPKITVNPQNVTVEGNNITLQCVFDFSISRCGWTRNGTDVEIKGRYQYADKNSNGRNTSNCSMLIKSLKLIDDAFWECYGERFNEGRSKINSQLAYLNIATTPTVHPKNATVLEGEDKILQCKFNKEIDSCVWLRNGSAIEMTDRYRYYNSDDSGTNTKDCSMEITQFSKIEATSWQCFSNFISDSKIQTCMSNVAYLTILNPATMCKRLCISDSGEIYSSTIPTIIQNSTLMQPLVSAEEGLKNHE